MKIFDWKASEDVVELRMFHCRSCDKYNSKLNLCNECGCLLTLKTTIKQVECPLGKWKKIDE